MNTSQKTRLIAQGIYLWASVQDSPMDTKESPIWKAWNAWMELNPQWVDFVKMEQFDLFDRVNAKF